MKAANRNKKLKGMTLVEIVIALFIFGLISLMMVNIVNTSMSLMRNATHVNNKVTVEGPVAELKQKTNADLENDNLKITVNVSGCPTVNIKAESYNTQNNATDPLEQTNANIDLKFVDMNLALKTGSGLWIEPETEAETE